MLFRTRLLGSRSRGRNDEEIGAVEDGDDVLHDAVTLWLPGGGNDEEIAVEDGDDVLHDATLWLPAE